MSACEAARRPLSQIRRIRLAQKELIWRIGVEEIHINRVKSADQFKKPLRDNDGRDNELFLMEKFILSLKKVCTYP